MTPPALYSILGVSEKQILWIRHQHHHKRQFPTDTSDFAVKDTGLQEKRFFFAVKHSPTIHLCLNSHSDHVPHIFLPACSQLIHSCTGGLREKTCLPVLTVSHSKVIGSCLFISTNSQLLIKEHMVREQRSLGIVGYYYEVHSSCRDICESDCSFVAAPRSWSVPCLVIQSTNSGASARI